MLMKANKTILNLPKHIAIILDGNRRWAKKNNLPTAFGHKKGLDAAIKIARYARKTGIHTLTLWGFSTENWNRSKTEINYLMSLFSNMIDQYLEEAKKEQVRIYHLGRKDRLPKKLTAKIIQAEKETKKNKQNVLNLAIDYGGQDEILRAMVKAIADIKAQKIKLSDLLKPIGKYNQKYAYYLFKNYLDTKDQPYPYPDLIIRTSGEQRLSGFVLWQSAYSEYYFEPCFLPDYSPALFDQAVLSYSKRKRRFGGN